MRSFSEFIKESVVYKPTDHSSMANAEHNETTHQSNAMKSGEMESPHPAIASAIRRFAKNKRSFHSALVGSKVERIERGTEVGNSDIGNRSANLHPTKQNRVRRMIGRGEGIHRPIILRHKDPNTGEIHNHLLAGNTRATVVGYGIQAHIIHV